MLRMFTDGASRGNPGHAAVGVMIQDQQGVEVEAISRYVGLATNNEAEYLALLEGLRAAAAFGAQRLDIFMDSELLVNQLNGSYKVREPRLMRLFLQARQQMQQFGSVRIRHVPREQNRVADALANQALDERDPQA